MGCGVYSCLVGLVVNDQCWAALERAVLLFVEPIQQFLKTACVLLDDDHDSIVRIVQDPIRPDGLAEISLTVSKRFPLPASGRTARTDYVLVESVLRLASKVVVNTGDNNEEPKPTSAAFAMVAA